MSAQGYNSGFGQYQHPPQPPYAAQYGHGAPAYDPHYAPYADNASHKRQRHGSGSAPSQTAPGHQYQPAYAVAPQQQYGHQSVYQPPHGPVPPPNIGMPHALPYGYRPQVPPPPPAPYAAPYGGAPVHPGQAQSSAYGTWDRGMTPTQPPPAMPAHYPPQAHYPQPAPTHQPTWAPPPSAFQLQQDQQPIPPPPLPLPPPAPQAGNLNTNRTQRPLRRNNPQDSRNGVSRTATSLQWRPPQSSTSAAKSQSPTTSDTVSGSRPVTSSGLPSSNAPESSIRAAAHSPTGQGRKRKVSESIEPTNAISAMLVEPIYLPTYDDGDRSGDDANPNGYHHISPTLDEADSWFWTADTQNTEQLSIGNIHWKPPEYLRQALPPTLERADALDLHTWISPRGFNISAYAKGEEPVHTSIDPKDPAARSLLSPGYTGLTALVKQLSSAAEQGEVPVTEMQNRAPVSAIIEGRQASKQSESSASIQINDTAHTSQGQPVAHEEHERPPTTASKTVQPPNNFRNPVSGPKDDDEEPYSPPPAGAPLQPGADDLKAKGEDHSLPSEEHISATANVAIVNGNTKRPRRDSQDRPTSKRSRAGSKGSEDLSNKPPPAHHSRSNSTSGKKHRRTGSAEPGTFFPVDQAQEDALAALGVTGPAARVYNMPGPARTPSRGTTPEMAMPRHRPPSRGTTIDSRQQHANARPTPGESFASTAGVGAPQTNGISGRRWVPPPPPVPPPSTNSSLNHLVFLEHSLDNEPRPSSANSNHTQWSDAAEKIETLGRTTPTQPVTPGPPPADQVLTPIRESPEGLSSGQKRKRAADDDSQPTRRRQAPDLTRPPKYKPPINPVYE